MTSADPIHSFVVNTFTRRNFMKTTALAAGAVAVLSQGRALAADGSSGSHPVTEYRKDFEWRIVVTASPLKPDGTIKTKETVVVEVNDSWANNKVGVLTMTVEALVFPEAARCVTGRELVEGIPAAKLLTEVRFQQKGQLELDNSILAFAHIDDSRLPDKSSNNGWAITPSVSEQLQYYAKSVNWFEGKQSPPDPASPDFLDNPDADSAKCIAPSSTHLAMVGEWSAFGWTWVGILKDKSALKLTITHVGEWTPQGMEAKTTNIALVWGLRKVRRERLLKKDPKDGVFRPVIQPETDQAGWTKWLPE